MNQHESDSNCHRSQSQNRPLIPTPESESFPIIIMLVCKINMLKSVINKTTFFTYQVIFLFKILLDCVNGIKNYSVVEMYS